MPRALSAARRRISLSIKQAAEGGELAEEYRQHFEVDEHGNWTAGADDSEREAAWAEYYSEGGEGVPPEGEPPAGLEQKASAAAEVPESAEPAAAEPAADEVVEAEPQA